MLPEQRTRPWNSSSRTLGRGRGYVKIVTSEYACEAFYGQ